MNQVINILESTRNLIKDEKHWIKGVSAADKEGREVDEAFEDAYQWCLIGAINKVSYQKDDDVRAAAVAVLWRRKKGLHYIEMVRSMGIGDIVYIYHKLQEWNDDATTQHTDIIDAIDESISILKEKHYN